MNFFLLLITECTHFVIKLGRDLKKCPDSLIWRRSGTVKKERDILPHKFFIPTRISKYYIHIF